MIVFTFTLVNNVSALLFFFSLLTRVQPDIGPILPKSANAHYKPVQRLQPSILFIN